MIISLRQLPPENKAVDIHCFGEQLNNLKAVKLNGRMFWFYVFSPLDVYKFYNSDKHKWSF